MTHLCLPHKALQAVHVLDGLQGERQSSRFYKKGRGEDEKKATSKKIKKLCLILGNEKLWASGKYMN